MARKKRPSIADRLGHAVSDIADAVSVAATGSQIGVLELAAEDDLDIRKVKLARTQAAKKAVKKRATAKTKPAVKKKAAPKRTAKASKAKKTKRR